MCREFAEAELQPVAAALDKQQKFPTDQVNAFSLPKKEMYKLVH